MGSTTLGCIGGLAPNADGVCGGTGAMCVQQGSNLDSLCASGKSSSP